MNDHTHDTAVRTALDRIDRAERNYKLAFFGAAMVELAFLVTFVLLADFGDRLHVLLLLSTVAVYSIVVLGLVALAEWGRRHILLVIKGIEALGR